MLGKESNFATKLSIIFVKMLASTIFLRSSPVPFHDIGRSLLLRHEKVHVDEGKHFQNRQNVATYLNKVILTHLRLFVFVKLL